MNKSKKSHLTRYLILILIATLAVTGVTFSSYKSTSQGGSSTAVALFCSTVVFDVPVADLYPGCDPVVVPITVSNYDNDKVCEVSQSYEITALPISGGKLPLDISFDAETGSVGNFYVSEGAREREHTLIISWHDGETDYTYSDEIEVIRVTVVATQID